MVEVGTQAPDFSLPDATGQTHRLADALADGPVVLAFLKADCATCHLAFPYLERLYQTYPGERWRLWGICQHPARAAEWFARTIGVTFPLLVDDDGLSVSVAYDPSATPTIFLIGPANTVQAQYLGFAKADLNALTGQLAALLNEEPIVIAPADDGKPAFRPG